jgi:single-strand DNA-binding protein
MLRVSLLGNLGADPEVRYSQKGTQIVSFRVAVNQIRTGPDGERQEATEWFRVRVSNRQSEFVQRLSKGARVLVMGRLDIGHFQGKDGESRTSFDVWADEVQTMARPGAEALGAGSAEGEGEGEAQEGAVAGVSSLARGQSALPGSSQPRNGRPPARTSSRAAEGGPSRDLDDLPF